ncbi:unnamed protein product [Citrullus colocynthis]|uniref:Uncharacterized protein n=1 Tax=Citrullus colocynthis TaxID=252529 RepID=A0ABP0YQC5_9ROSI
MAVFSENLLKIGRFDEGKEFLFLLHLKWRNRASQLQFMGFHGGLKRISLKPIMVFSPYIAADIETGEIVQRRSRKKVIAENRRVEMRNLWERIALKLKLSVG